MKTEDARVPAVIFAKTPSHLAPVTPSVKPASMTKKPHTTTSTRSSRALELLQQNPGLTIEAAAAFVGIEPQYLYEALNRRKAKNEGRCPTCLRYFRATKKRPLPIDECGTVVPAKPPTYDQITRNAYRQSRPQPFRKKQSAKIRHEVERAKQRAQAKAEGKRFNWEPYTRNGKWKVLSVDELADLL